MTEPIPPAPLLDLLYGDFLRHGNPARFIRAFSQHYMLSTLERLAEFGSSDTRRGATVALGLVGDYRSNAVLGRRMSDGDRTVRSLAENAIREVWCRDGSEPQRLELQVIVRLNSAGQDVEAERRATDLIQQAPFFAEAWNQRAIAWFHQEHYQAAANDCHQSLELNPYHFGSAVGMGHCYLEMEDAHAALESFRRALRLNPGLEGVRAQVVYLERALEDI